MMPIYDPAPVRPVLNALIVEDSDDDAELLIYQITRGGYKLNYIRVENEDQMRRALLDQAWDIVISDYQLPTFSAPEALACLKKHALDLPFIVVSGVIDEETSVNILSAGAHDFILKGRWSRLIPAIQREVREAKERQARFRAEQSARIAAEQYRVIFETIGTPIMLVNRQLRTLLVNTPLLKLTGLEKNELIGSRKWMQLLNRDELRQVTGLYFSGILAGQTDHTSFEVILADHAGKKHVVIATIAIVPGTDDAIISLLEVTERKQAEENLRQSESLNRAVIDHSPLGISIRKPGGELIQSNQVWDQLWEMPDPHIGTGQTGNYWEYLLTHVPQIEAAKSTILKIFKDGGEYFFPELNVKAIYPYSIDWVSLHIYSLMNGARQVDRIVLLAQDISARKKTELALQQSEELFAKAFQSNPDGMLINQRADGTIIEVNQQWEQLFGYSRAETVGKTTKQLNVYENYADRENLLAMIDQLGSVKVFELNLRKKDGEILLVALSAEPVKINQIDCILYTFHDITEIRRTEKALIESEDRYKVLFENNPTIMVLFDPQTLKFVDANPAACHFYGYTRDEFKEGLITKITERESDELHRLIDDILGNQQIRYQGKHRLASGEMRDVEVFSGPIAMGGKQIIISTVQDISERVAADKSLQKRVDELDVLHAIALVGAEANNEDYLIERATQVIAGKLYSDVTGILLLDASQHFLIPHRSYWGINQDIRGKKVSIDRCASGQAIITGSPIRCNDVSSLPVYFEVNPSIHSELCVPIKSGDRSIGVINIESTRYDAYTEADEQLMLTVAGQMATAIERLRTEKAERDQAQQLSTIYEIGQEVLTARMDAEQVYRSIHRAVGQLMPCEAFVIVRVDPDQKDLETVYAIDRGGRAPVMRLPLNSGVSGTVISTGQSFLYADFSKITGFQNVVYFGDPEHTRSGCAVPLRLRGQIIGCLSTQSYSPDAYTYSHLHLLELLAAYAAIALDNYQLLYETQRQTLTLENMFDAVILANKDGVITRWNTSAEKLFGYPKDEAMGLSPAILFNLSDGEYRTFINEVYRLAIKDSRWSGEVDIVTKSGIRGTAEIVILIIYDSSKAITGTIFVFRDITQRKLAEKVLKDSEEEFRNTFEQAAVGIAHTTLKGQFIKINRRFCDLLGYTQDEMLKKSIKDITYQDDLMGNLDAMQQLINGEIQTYATEKRYIRKDGSLIWVQLTVNIARDANGQPVYFIPLVEDITKRKLSELETLKLVSAVEQSDESIVITDLKGTITYANPAVEAVTGYTLNEVIGKKSNLFKSGSHDKAFYDNLWATITNGEAWKGTIINRRKNGALYYEDGVIFPIKDPSNHIMNFAAVKRDITERVFRERSLQLIVDYSTELRKASNIESILSLTFDFLTNLFQVTSAFVLTRDPLNHQLGINQGFGGWNKFNQTLDDLLAPIGLSISQGDPSKAELWGDNLPRITNLRLGEDGLFVTTAPLMAQEKNRGVLCIGRQTKLTNVEISFLYNFVEITGNAIHRHEMYETAQQHANQLGTVSALGRSLAEILDMADIYPVVSRAVKDLLNESRSVLITQYQPAQETITAIYELVYGNKAQEGASGWLPLDPTGQELQSKTILGRQPVIQNDINGQIDKQVRLGPIHEDTRSILLVPMQAKGQVLGVIQVQSSKPNYYDQQKAELLTLIGNTTAIAIDNLDLYRKLQRSNTELILANDDTILGWSKAMSWRDNETEEHNQRVADITVNLARSMGLDEDQLVYIRRGALLHDIGKIGIPDDILLKNGPLTEKDWLRMREHPKIAYEILSPISFLHNAIDIPYNHHERWDGSGYPRGLVGESIPLSARIFSVIDVWDALLNERRYRKAWPANQVIEYIKKKSGIYFDPRVVTAFLDLVTS